MTRVSGKCSIRAMLTPGTIKGDRSAIVPPMSRLNIEVLKNRNQGRTTSAGAAVKQVDALEHRTDAIVFGEIGPYEPAHAPR